MSHPSVATTAIANGGAEPCERRREPRAAIEHAAIGRVARDGELPLSWNQEGCLYAEWLARLQGAAVPANHAVHSLQIVGPLDVAALERALGTVVARHEVLRTAFGFRDDAAARGGRAAARPFTIAIEPSARATILERTVEDLPDEERWRAVGRIAEAALAQPFDYGRAPLLRAIVVRVAAETHVLILVAHHLICDGWSFQVIRQELHAAYEAVVDGREPQLPTLSAQYVDFAAWERRRLGGDTLRRLTAYWREYWTAWGADAIDARDLHAGGDGVVERVQVGRAVSLPLDAALARRLRALAHRHDVTLYATCLTALGVALRALLDVPRAAVWGHYANRRPETVEPLVGWFSTSHLLGLDLSGDPALRVLLERVRRGVLAGLAYQELPLPLLMRDLSTTIPRGARAHPAFERPRVSLDMRTVVPSAGARTTMTPVTLASGVAASIALQIIVTSRGDELSLGALYAAHHLRESDAARVLKAMRVALRAIVSGPEQRLSRATSAVAAAR